MYSLFLFYIFLFLFFFFFFFFFFNDTATTEIYTLSLHDALPISLPFLICSSNTALGRRKMAAVRALPMPTSTLATCVSDRKSTRLNSSHSQISYAVFCLKKKKKKKKKKDKNIRI